MEKQTSSSGRVNPNPSAGETDSWKRFIELFDEYVKSLNQLSQDQYQRLAGLHNDFVKAFNETASQQKGAAPFDTLFFDYAKKLMEQASPEIRNKEVQRLRDSYVQYLRGVQAAWSQLNVEKLDPASVATLARHLWAAACFAGTIAPAQ